MLANIVMPGACPRACPRLTGMTGMTGHLHLDILAMINFLLFE